MSISENTERHWLNYFDHSMFEKHILFLNY